MTTIYGWRNICAYLGLTRKRIIALRYPVFTMPYNRLVLAEKEALDKHTERLKREYARPVAQKEKSRDHG